VIRNFDFWFGRKFHQKMSEKQDRQDSTFHVQVYSNGIEMTANNAL